MIEELFSDSLRTNSNRKAKTLKIRIYFITAHKVYLKHLQVIFFLKVFFE